MVYSHCQGVWGRMAKRKHMCLPRTQLSAPTIQTTLRTDDDVAWALLGDSDRQGRSSVNLSPQELRVWKASMHRRGPSITELSEARYRSDPSERPRCGWLTRCFDRTGTEHPEHCLLHHPARSAPDQMPRVTGAQRCTWERHLDLECRARSRLTTPWPGRARALFSAEPFVLFLWCAETMHVCRPARLWLCCGEW